MNKNDSAILLPSSEERRMTTTGYYLSELSKARQRLQAVEDQQVLVLLTGMGIGLVIGCIIGVVIGGVFL